MSKIIRIALDEPAVTRRRLDILEPKPEIPRRLIAFFLVHGGGWHSGSRRQYYPAMRYFSSHGHIAAATGYRLRKQGVSAFEQLLDVRQSYSSFLQHLRQSSPEETPQVVVMGSSAGAHLASLLAYAHPGECGEPLSYRGKTIDIDNWTPPVGAVLVCAPGQFTPWPEIHPGIWSSMQKAAGAEYTDETKPRFEQLSPSTYWKNKPCSTFLVGSENEIFFPHFMLRQWQREMMEAGRLCKLKIYPDQSHGFLYGCDAPGQREAMSDILSFVESLDFSFQKATGDF